MDVDSLAKGRVREEENKIRGKAKVNPKAKTKGRVIGTFLQEFLESAVMAKESE